MTKWTINKVDDKHVMRYTCCAVAPSEDHEGHKFTVASRYERTTNFADDHTLYMLSLHWPKCNAGEALSGLQVERCDCGYRSALGDDDAWWDDDEAYWDDDYEWDDVANREWADLKYDDDDAAPIAIIRSLPHPSEAKEPRVVGEPGAGGVFVVLLQSVVYLTGALFLCSGIAYLIAQRNAGKDIWQAVPTLEPTDFEPKKAAAAVELTPDVSYSGK